MEDRKTIFDYLSQVMTTFGVSILIMNIVCYIFGENAQDVSQIFLLGNKGLPTSIIMEFLLLSIFVNIIRYLFLTDSIIKNLSITFRTLGMLLSIITIIAIFIYLFHWFPVNMWEAWLAFFICFGMCFFISVIICALKENAENKKMAQALKKKKAEWSKKNDIYILSDDIEEDKWNQ